MTSHTPNSTHRSGKQKSKERIVAAVEKECQSSRVSAVFQRDQAWCPPAYRPEGHCAEKAVDLSCTCTLGKVGWPYGALHALQPAFC